MKNPFISIITPAYKVENTLKRTVLSAIKQDFLDWEMIIISDDHQDYEQVLRFHNISDPRLRFTSTNQLGSGSSNARNKGLAIAEGQYIACLDADDEFKPNKLSKMIPLVEKYGAAVSEVEMRDSDSSALVDKFNNSSDSPYLTPKELLWVCLHTCSLYLYDRYKIPDLSYENDILRMQDLIFLMSFFNHIDLIGFTPEALHIYYKRQGSACNSSNTHETFHQSKIKILDKIKNHQISVKNDLAIAEIQRTLNLSLATDKIYDQEVQKNPNVNWLDLFKAQVTAQNYLQ